MGLNPKPRHLDLSPLIRACVRTVAFGSLLLIASASRAVIFFSTPDPTHNTTEPTGDLAGSGWQYLGSFSSFVGTPIAPNLFITAKHFGASVGEEFFFRGATYVTTAYFDDPNSDLRIWRVCGVFSAFAPLYTATDETGKAFVVFGRGTQRGEAVVAGSLLGQMQKGWLWGAEDNILRWGQNDVDALVDTNGMILRPSERSTPGTFLKAGFSANGGPNEAHLTGGDSGGAVFIRDGTVWKLAGINSSVDGPYNTVNSDPGFNAAIYDEGGLYKKNQDRWVLIPDLPSAQPGNFYASRISANLPWINSVIAQPSADTPVLQSAETITGTYTDASSTVADTTNRTLTVPLPAGTAFYRLRGCTQTRINNVSVRGSMLIFRYE